MQIRRLELSWTPLTQNTLTVIKATRRAGKLDAAAGKENKHRGARAFPPGIPRVPENTGGEEEQNSGGATGELREPVPSGGGVGGSGRREREREREAGMLGRARGQSLVRPREESNRFRAPERRRFRSTGCCSPYFGDNPAP